MREIEAASGFSALGNETRLAIFKLLVRAGDQGFATVRSIVGADDELITDGSELLLPKEQVFGTRTNDGNHVVASVSQCFGYGIDGRDANSSAYA